MSKSNAYHHAMEDLKTGQQEIMAILKRVLETQAIEKERLDRVENDLKTILSHQTGPTLSNKIATIATGQRKY